MHIFFPQICVMTKKDILRLHPVHPWHERYIRMTADLPVLEVLENHQQLFNRHERTSLEQLGDQTYSPGKWTVKDILQHLIDTERILSYRALCIARNSQIPIPGFDEAEYAQFTNAAQRSIGDLLRELDLLRQASIALFENFDERMLTRTGLCSDIEISVLALGYVITGHGLHHRQIIHQNYFPLLQP